MKPLQFVPIEDTTLASGKRLEPFSISYQVSDDDTAKPLVVVIHALTGNSQVTGENGWWKDVIGIGQAIDTDTYRVLAFNIPGNGYDGRLFENYKDFCAADIARFFWQALDILGENDIFMLIGGSLGGGLAWEMATLRPTAVKHLVPVATHWQATDWILAQALVQESILSHSDNSPNGSPSNFLNDALTSARMHAMTIYRSPESLREKFNRTKYNDDLFNVESWLQYHGEKLNERFTLQAYRLMNQILRTLDAGSNNRFDALSTITAHIHLVAVDSDYLFIAEDTRKTQQMLQKQGRTVDYYEIQSSHGHDGFLTESKQLSKILSLIIH